MEPFSAGMFASIGSALKFADVAVRIAEVGSENAVFVRTIQVVRSDLEEVERLWSLDAVQKKLAGTPGKLPWIKTAILNTRSALNEIGRWVERARVEHETTGSIKFDTRVRWVFNDHEKLLNRKTELLTCHQQLSNVLSYLMRLEYVPVNPAPPEYENLDCFDEILSRHRRATGPKTSKAEVNTTAGAWEDRLPGVTTVKSETAPFDHSIPVPGARSPPNVQAASAYDRRDSTSSPSLSSTLSSPGSPPPTYAADVPIDPIFRDVRLDSQTTIETKHAINQSVGCRSAPQDKQSSAWACRSNFEGIAISELVGDTVLFSATNSAGPVNAYELCPTTKADHRDISRSAQRPCEHLAELLGDLHFPVELPGNDPGPPPGYPSQTRARFDQVGLSRSKHTQLRKRTKSETPPMVQRRPTPANAHSDSLLTSNQVSMPLAMQKAVPSRTEKVLRSSVPEPVTTELSIESAHQSHVQNRASSHTAQAPIWVAPDASLQSSKQCSTPTPVPLAFNVNAAAYSAKLTSSWGLDTQPKMPKAPNAQKLPPVVTRMQSQKHLLNLLGSIDT